MNVCNTSTIQDAWAREQDVTVHGWIYDLKDGRLKDLGMSVRNTDELESRYQATIQKNYAYS